MNQADSAAAMICALDVDSRLDKSGTLEQRIRQAFSIAKDFWMSTDDQVHFSGALAGVMKSATDEEKEIIAKSSRALNRFNLAIQAAQSGVEVDMAALAKQQEEEKPLPLLGWWHDAKKAA